jgi:hypothetical protein
MNKEAIQIILDYIKNQIQAIDKAREEIKKNSIEKINEDCKLIFKK